MTVYQPVCTCAVPGISGCAVHGRKRPLPEPPCDCPPGWKHQPDCKLVIR